MNPKPLACVAGGIMFVGYAAFLVGGLLTWTPLGAAFGQKWRYNGGKGLGLISPFPDQSAIAYSSDHSGSNHVYTVEWGGTTVRQLTYDARSDSDVCVSPTGGFIVFARQDGNSVHLWVMKPNGTGQKQLTFGTTCQTEPAISADGRKIAYVESSPATGNYALAAMNADGTGQTRLTGGSRDVQDTTPVFDPTGTKIYFSRYQFDGSDRMGVWVIGVTGSGEHFVAPGNHPAVSPDGEKIVFLDAPQNQTLGLMNKDGTGRREIGHDIGYGSCLRYAPDGHSILVLSSGDNRTIVSSIRPDGTGLRKIATLE